MKQCAKKVRAGTQQPTVRDHTGGMKDETSLSEGGPQLHAHQRVVQVHSGRCVGVEGRVEIWTSETSLSDCWYALITACSATWFPAPALVITVRCFTYVLYMLYPVILGSGL
jgi:hypothetical protein